MTESGTTTAPPRQSRLLAAVAALVAGGALTLLAGSHTWRIAATRSIAPGPDGTLVPVAGVPSLEAAPGIVHGLGLVALAAIVALFAVRGVARTLVGALLVAVGVGLGAAAAPRVGRAAALYPHIGPTVWPAVACVGAALVVAAGLLVVRHGRSWPSLSTRYERESRAASRPPTSWEVIDRGEDPTA